MIFISQIEIDKSWKEVVSLKLFNLTVYLTKNGIDDKNP